MTIYVTDNRSCYFSSHNTYVNYYAAKLGIKIAVQLHSFKKITRYKFY